MVEQRELRGEINRVLLIVLAVALLGGVVGCVVVKEQKRAAQERASREETQRMRKELDRLPGLTGR